MPTRLEIAKKAYAKKNLEETKKAHTKEAIEEDIHGKGRGEYLGDFVFGAMDGCVTTFAVVAGVSGASLGHGIVIIMGFANLLGDGFSMALGNYLSVRSTKEFVEKERQREEWEVENYPKGEIEEIREIYKKKGFQGEDLENAVKVITSNKKVWVDTMIREELNLNPESRSPFWGAFTTFIAFFLVGLIPLLAYVAALFLPSISTNTFKISLILTLTTFFLVGAAKHYVTEKSWLKSGFETLFVGSSAAFLAYIVGYLLKTVAHVVV